MTPYTHNTPNPVITLLSNLASTSDVDQAVRESAIDEALETLCACRCWPLHDDLCPACQGQQRFLAANHVLPKEESHYV